MCGVVGIWARDYGGDLLREDLKAAVSSLHHRGPDDHGIWLNESGVGLGHTRLSILDLSPLGHQPMVSADGRYVLVFNGEIYNFEEIRKDLVSAGHSFAGSGDTEVLLHAFSEWGPAAVGRFIGMFAIALWDEQEQALELYRDRIGVKPLYFAWHGGTLCFASELKALRSFRHWKPEIDQQALGEFLQFGYIPDDRSIYRGVSKLRPGHRLRLCRGKEPVVEPYWSVIAGSYSPLNGSNKDIERELESLLIDAFRYRMVSDVPVGVYLSGGVDSSLVTAILAKHHNQTIRTFTIGFSDEKHDESAWARKVADHCGTLHTEYILESGEALEIARNWGRLFDEPFADSSSIPTLLVSRLASEEVKVVLSADGGDELFCGYNAYPTVLDRNEKLARVPAWLQAAASSGLRMSPPDLVNALLSMLQIPAKKRGNLIRRMRGWREMLRTPTPVGLMDNAMSFWYPDQIRRLLGGYREPMANRLSDCDDAAIEISLRDFHHYLPGDILTKVDRTTMAVSIEGREPLLDHRIAEFAFRLPPHLRRGSLGPKHILKKILYSHIPREYVDRPKQGFSIPKASWLNGDLKELVDQYLSPGRIREAGIMDESLTGSVVKDFYAGNTSLTEQLWILLTFEMWREYWG